MNQRIDRLNKNNELPKIWGTRLIDVIAMKSMLYSIFFNGAMNNGG